MFLSIHGCCFCSCGGPISKPIRQSNGDKCEIVSHVLWNPNVRIMYITYSSTAEKKIIVFSQLFTIENPEKGRSILTHCVISILEREKIEQFQKQ